MNRMEAVNHENCDLKRQVETLESNHRSLLAQLHKLQALVAKVPRSSSHTSATTGNNSNAAAAAVSATQTGTVLMVSVHVCCVSVCVRVCCPHLIY